MKKNKKKISSMVDELTTYFFSMGSTEMEVQIRETEDGYWLRMRANFSPSAERKVRRLGELLGYGRTPEIEESYWGLGGTGDMEDEHELLVIGAMVDSAQVTVADGEAQLELFRRK